MALKKSQLYSSLWQSCDELRGGMDASQYKRDHVFETGTLRDRHRCREVVRVSVLVRDVLDEEHEEDVVL